MEHERMNDLTFAEVIEIEKVGEGTRVCLDMIDTLSPEEGLLVGNTGNGYVLLLSENRSTNTYPARPFRINCGAHHQYLYLGDQTSYLSEIKPGMELPIISRESIRFVAVGRVKIEKRLFLRMVCRIEGVEISATLQETDSVHVLDENLKAKNILDIQPGHKILTMKDEPGRHLGEKIKGEIEER